VALLLCYAEVLASTEVTFGAGGALSRPSGAGPPFPAKLLLRLPRPCRSRESMA
jgi:hypothetical protein